MNVAAGGHISHGHKATLTGRDYGSPIGVRRDTERIDLDEVRDLARKRQPRMIVAGGSAYPRIIDFAGLRAIADEVGALFLVVWRSSPGSSPPSCIPILSLTRMSKDDHIQIAARRARRPCALERSAFFSAINGGVFPGVQGSVMLHAIAGKAACFGEALSPEFKELQPIGARRRARAGRNAVGRRLVHCHGRERTQA